MGLLGLMKKPGSEAGPGPMPGPGAAVSLWQGQRTTVGWLGQENHSSALRVSPGQQDLREEPSTELTPWGKGEHQKALG